MKKTFPVNINGSIFYIDEDAYSLLNTYLKQLRQAFPGEEGSEIVADIEGRISELFNDIISSGSNVITLEDVNRVIEKMGQPSALSDSIPETPSDESTYSPRTETTPPPFPAVSKKLYRNMQNKVFGGVLSGVACYFGWNTNILRLLVIVLALFTYVWPLIIIYLLAWMVIPAAITPRQILEMRGAPVTVGNIGQTIIGSVDPEVNGRNDGNILSALGKIILMFFGFIAALVAIGTLTAFIKMLCGLILGYGWNNFTLLNDFSFIDRVNPGLGAVGSICLLFCIAIPCIAVVWATCSVVFKVRGISKPLLIGGLILEILLIIAATVLLTLSKVHFLTEMSYLPASTGIAALTSAAQISFIHF